jgi:hypothetical protein
MESYDTKEGHGVDESVRNILIICYASKLMSEISIVCPPPFKVGESQVVVPIGGNHGNISVISSKAADTNSTNAINISCAVNS